MAEKTILDVCCGGRMMWFDKDDNRVIFLDKRKETHTYIGASQNGAGSGKEYKISVNPDCISDFTALPFQDNAFSLVVFDPPHFSKIGNTSHTAKKYGKLPPNWKIMLRNGFSECFRVLRQDGFLVFKWNEYEIPVSDILALAPEKPLFGNRYGKTAMTHWITFTKPNNRLQPTDFGVGTQASFPLLGGTQADESSAKFGGG
jgi:hypothetical protein